MKILILISAVFGFITVSTVKTAPSENVVSNQKYKECTNAYNASRGSCNKMQISCPKMKDGKIDKCVWLCKY